MYKRQVEIIRAGSGAHVDLKALLQKLGEREICSVFVEGGGSVNFSLLEAGLVDKVYAFIAPKLVGGREALTPVEGEGFASLGECVALTDVHVEELAGDILLTAYTKRCCLLYTSRGCGLCGRHHECRRRWHESGTCIPAPKCAILIRISNL